MNYTERNKNDLRESGQNRITGRDDPIYVQLRSLKKKKMEQTDIEA